MVRILVRYLLSLIFPFMGTLQQPGIMAPFCHWILPSGEADRAVAWPGPPISMACFIPAALMDADPQQPPLEVGYSNLPGFPIRLKS